MREPERKIFKRFESPEPNFPKKPLDIPVPFDEPKVRCSIPTCQNFEKPTCTIGLCEEHCKQFHKGVHVSPIKKNELSDIVKKYFKEKKRNKYQ